MKDPVADLPRTRSPDRHKGCDQHFRHPSALQFRLAITNSQLVMAEENRSPDQERTGQKRKNGENTPQQRAKRSRYISIAW